MKKLTKMSWYKYCGAKFSKRVRARSNSSNGWRLPPSLNRKQFARATYSTRAWSAHNTQERLCTASLLQLLRLLHLHYLLILYE